MTPERAMFWKIDNVWLFYVIAFFAVGLFVIGISAHIFVWLKSTPKGKVSFSRQALKQIIPDILLGLRVFKGDLAAGIAHFLIFWGFVILFIGTSLLLVHDHFYSFLVGKNYLLFKPAMEVGGLSLSAGIIWALVRRYIQRVPRLERRLEDAVVPLWLLVMTLSGFLLEGLRLAAQRPPWGNWSFVGSLIGGLVPAGAAESIYPNLWWCHALLGLGLVAIIPYTKLFHLIGAPAAYYLHHSAEGPIGTSLSLMEPGESSYLGDAVVLDACMRCGRCAQACPSTGAGEPFAPRDFVQAMRHSSWQKHSLFGDIRFLSKDHAIDDKAAWYCTTCAACLEVCPIYNATFKTISQKRALLVEEGKEVPDIMNQTLERLFNYENPWVASKRERAAWAKGLDIPALKAGGKESQLCYFVGCTTPFDARAQEMAKSFSSLLKHAGVSFGILGDKEPCCGDIARVVGELGLFQEKMENCLELFDKYSIKDVVTSSPHCFHSFLNEYSGTPFRVRHYSSVLKELMADGRLKPKNAVNSTVTYHDPCYLGRHNRIFDEPREIICSIPGITLIEMSHHGPDSLCCGGGGGRMWQGQDLRGEARMSEIRIKEARETGADILITACPLCLIMLEDALKTARLEGELKVMDLNELVLQSLA
jgi:Fe-S oxidoreductase/nitrate reductase gamma subunit